MAQQDGRDGGPARLGLDRAGSDQEELRAEVLRLLPPGPVDTRPPPSQEAADATGSVRVRVDSRGRVIDVDIGRRWRDRLDADGLPAAILEAHTTARQQAMVARALASFAAAEAGESAPGAAAVPVAPREDWIDPTASPRDRLAAARARLDRIRAARERLARIWDSGAPESRDHTGPHGYLTATLQGFTITAITGDARRIWYAEVGHLSEDALDVLSAAQPAGDPAGRGGWI